MSVGSESYAPQVFISTGNTVFCVARFFLVSNVSVVVFVVTTWGLIEVAGFLVIFFV